MEQGQNKSGANAYQHGGQHYKKLSIEIWDFIYQNRIPYMEGQIIRYATRWRDKAGMEDLLKLRHYVEKLIELERSRGLLSKNDEESKKSNFVVSKVADHVSRELPSGRAALEIKGTGTAGTPAEIPAIYGERASTAIKKVRLHNKLEKLDDETINFLHDDFVRW